MTSKVGKPRESSPRIKQSVLKTEEQSAVPNAANRSSTMTTENCPSDLAMWGVTSDLEESSFGEVGEERLGGEKLETMTINLSFENFAGIIS